MKMTERPRLLLVEDDLEIGQMLTEMLQDDYVVTHMLTGEEGLADALARAYSVIVLDRRLPGMDGVAVASSIRRAGITTPILMLTALDAIEDVVSGLDGGVNDYVTKPFRIAELKARLRALRRGFEESRTRREIGSWTFLVDARTVFGPYGQRVQLTETESRLLRTLSDSPLRTFPREQLRDAVFTAEDSLGAVDTYVHYLRRKIVPEIVETVHGAGYRLGQPE